MWCCRSSPGWARAYRGSIKIQVSYVYAQTKCEASRREAQDTRAGSGGGARQGLNLEAGIRTRYSALSRSTSSTETEAKLRKQPGPTDLQSPTSTHVYY